MSGICYENSHIWFKTYNSALSTTFKCSNCGLLFNRDFCIHDYELISEIFDHKYNLVKNYKCNHV
jgi:hypothetical protein